MDSPDRAVPPAPDRSSAPAPAAPPVNSVDRTMPLSHPGGQRPGAPPGSPAERTAVLGNTTAAPGAVVNDYLRYTDFEPIASGGMGVVKSCRDPHLDREVAIKLLLPQHRHNAELRERFQREARVMAHIEHPSVVPVHELGLRESDGTPYFTMKKVHGETLEDILKGLADGKPGYAKEYTRARLLAIFRSVCQALAYAHNRGIIHRDLKPANILVGGFGEVLVMDWGLAKVLDEPPFGAADATMPAAAAGEQGHADAPGLPPTSANPTTTLDGTISGTPCYMAPEQARGDTRHLGPHSDQYSLGALLFELLTGERAVSGATVTEILAHVAAGPVVESPCQRAPLRFIPPELDAICRKAMAPRPEDRYEDVMALVDDLDNYEAGRPVSCYRDPLSARVWKACRRHPTRSAAVGVALLVLVTVASAIGVARAWRFRDLVTTGDKHRVSGTARYAEALAAYAELEREQAKPLPEPSRQVALLAQAERLRRAAENDYELAFASYIATGREVVREPRLLAGCAEIYRGRLAYAVRIGDWGEAQRLLDLLHAWLGRDFAGLSDSERRELQDIADQVRHGGRRAPPPAPRAQP